MMTNHLFDDQIQDYLDGHMALPAKMDMQRHLKECAVCRDAVAAYQDVYEVLTDETNFELPKNFTRKVLRQTHKHAVGSLQFGLMQIFFTFAAILVVINVLLTYVKVEKFASTAKTTSDAFRFILPSLSTTFQSFFGKIQFDGFYLVLAVVGLVVLFIFDRFVLQPRFKT